MIVRRDRRPPSPLTPWRAGLLFLACGSWLAGALSGRDWLTGAAIGLLLLVVALGLPGRSR